MRIKIYDSDTNDPLDLTDYTAKFYMAPRNQRDNPVIDGESVNITSAVLGEAEYRWQSGDTDTAGKYIYAFRFTSSNRSFTVPVVSPGIVVIEDKIG